jgi:hypothetical protein
MIIATTITQINNSDSEGCIVRNAEFVATPEFTLDEPAEGCTEAVLTYTLYDHTGQELDTLSYNITLADPEDSSELTFTYTHTSVGDLTLVTTLEECGTTVTETKIISVCDYLNITTPSCHTYTFGNYSLEDTVYVTFVQKDGTVLGTELQESTPNTDLTLTTTVDGIYYIKVYSDSEGETLLQTYIIIDSCDIETCLSTLSLEALCSDCATSKCINYCEKLYNLMQIQLLSLVFFNKVNREYALNRIYTVIDNTKISEMDNLDALITKIGKYCDTCGTTTTLTNAKISTGSSGDCGCGG